MHPLKCICVKQMLYMHTQVLHFVVSANNRGEWWVISPKAVTVKFVRFLLIVEVR